MAQLRQAEAGVAAVGHPPLPRADVQAGHEMFERNRCQERDMGRHRELSPVQVSRHNTHNTSDLQIAMPFVQSPHPGSSVSRQASSARGP